MTFLIDLLHPAHVHFFRHVHTALKAGGHTVVVTAREKDCTISLLNALGIEYRVLSKQKRGIIGLIGEMIVRTTALLVLCRKRRPDLLMGIMGPSIAVAGWILGIPRWVFYDTENAQSTNRFVYPLATRVYTPRCYRGHVRNQVTYPGYHELAYLHPNRFRPDRRFVLSAGLTPGEPFFLVRFVAWQASHDLRETGLSDRQKREIVKVLKSYGKVFVSAEGVVPRGLGVSRLPCPPAEIHHFLAHARMVVGESATMASEAAVLGVPAVFISNTFRGYTVDEEMRYGLVRNFTVHDFHHAVTHIRKVAANRNGKRAVARGRKKLLSENIDVADFVLKEIARMEKLSCVE